MSIIDALKPLHQALYFILWSLAQHLWDFDRVGLTMALSLESFRAFLVEQAAQIVALVADALVSPAGLFVTVALLVYGLWRLLALLFPDMAWRPVELPKVVLYAILMAAFFTAPAAAMGLLETARQELADGVQTTVIANLAPSFTPVGYVSGEPGLVVYDIDGRPGISGADLAASLVGVSAVSELGYLELPAAFRESYFTHGSPAEFTLNDENARTDALLAAGRGVVVLFLAPLAIFYAIGEALLWLTLAAVAVILWIGLPVALLLAPFRASEGLLAAYARRYVNLWIETIVSAALIGLLGGAMLEAAGQGFGLYLALAVLGGCVVIWRVLSAAKLAGAALENVGGADVTGGMGVGTAAKMTAAGGAAAVGGLVTGGLVAAGGALLAAGALVGKGEGGDGEGLPGAQAAALGGFLAGKSPRARNALQTFQEMRLVSGLHKADEPDALDAAYVGSLLSNRGMGSAYLALGMMDGPATAYRRLGLSSGDDGLAAGRGGGPTPPGTSRGGRRANWGVDEAGNNAADWELSPRQGSLLARLPARGGASDGQSGHPAPGGETAASPTAVYGGQQPQEWVTPSAADLAVEPVEASSTAAEPAARPFAPVTFTGRPEGTRQWVEMTAGMPAGPTRTGFIESAARVSGPAATTTAAAIERYGPAAVNAGVTAIARQTENYRAQGLNEAQILEQFRSGAGYVQAATHLPPDSPLRPETAGFGDWQAVADMTLGARAEASRAQLAAATATAVARPHEDAAAVAAAELGTSAHLGGYAGTVRVTAQRSREMGVDGGRLLAADAQLRQGNEAAAYETLRGGERATDAGARTLLNDLWSLPDDGLTIPQSAQVRSEPDLPGAANPSGAPIGFPSTDIANDNEVT
jgi:hypothetical protein